MATWMDKMAQEGFERAQETLKLEAEQENLKAAQDVQKRRIQEKQIRALRNNYRPAGGFLQTGGRGVSLGESSGLPSKLGNS